MGPNEFLFAKASIPIDWDNKRYRRECIAREENRKQNEILRAKEKIKLKIKEAKERRKKKDHVS